MMASLLDPDLKVVGSKRKNTKGHEGADQGLERVIATIEALLDDQETSIDQIGGIGIGCPGVVNLRAGILRTAPNLGWSEVPVRTVLESHFGVPIHVLNDVDAGAYGEYCLGAGRGSETLVAIFPGTGIGAGCVINGEMLTGRHASCMELGHTRVLTAGLCGGAGDFPVLEDLCSRLAIASACVVEAYRGKAPVLREGVETDLSQVKSGVIAKSVSKGEKAIQDIVDNAARYLGISVANLVNLLGPDRVVLGGGLTEKLPQIFLAHAKAAVERYAHPTLAAETEIHVAELGDNAVVAGAAAYAKRHSKEDA